MKKVWKACASLIGLILIAGSLLLEIPVLIGWNIIFWKVGMATTSLLSVTCGVLGLWILMRA